MNIIDRINKYLEINHISKYKFYKDLGLSNGFLNSNSNIGSDKCEKILSYYKDMNPEWLISGKGEMLRSEGDNTPVVNYTNIGSPYYNVDFQGGFDSLLNDQTVQPEYYINFVPFNKDGALWCNVSGKSMEPEISNGDKVALKEIKDWQTFLPMGEIYGIVTDEFRTIKRIRKSNKPDHWLLVPSNPAYDSQDIPIKKIRAIFQVLGSVKML